MIETEHGLNNRTINKQKWTKINKRFYLPITFHILQAYPAIDQWGCYQIFNLINLVLSLDLTELFLVLQVFCNPILFVRHCWTFCKERHLN